MSKRLESSRRVKPQKQKRLPIPRAIRREEARLAKIPDSEIDLSEIPEKVDWSDAVVGKYYRPMKETVSLSVDSKVLRWFKAKGRGYQARINKVLRNHFLSNTKQLG